jgi:diguanylate cyclase (GGDEF)-like protein
LLPDSTGEQAWHFAESLHQAIHAMVIEEEGAAIRFSASIGLVVCSQIISIEKAMYLADKALYRAKENGRNQSVFCQYADE